MRINLNFSPKITLGSLTYRIYLEEDVSYNNLLKESLKFFVRGQATS